LRERPDLRRADHELGLPSELGAGVPFNLRSDCELFLRFQVLNALGVSLNDFRPQATTRDFVCCLDASELSRRHGNATLLLCMHASVQSNMMQRSADASTHAVRPTASCIVWEQSSVPAERVEIEESKPRPHICANAPNGEERGAWAKRLLSDCGCGPMNLSACLLFGEYVNVARGVQGKQATSYCTSTGVRAGTACRNIAGYRNAKCKAQEAVVLRLVRDAVPNHRTGVSEGVCLGRARRM
jgi:hypothetical protein